MYKINRISTDEAEFLQILPAIDQSLKSLYYIGDLPEGRKPTVAIVGTRRPTVYGKEVAYRLSYDLASRGVIIVSGLALGIDAIAHQAALDAGGTTIAVLGNGLDKITPSANENLGKQIIRQGGAILSEYAPGTPAGRYTFLERNRIVSGLSDALIIVEAAKRSGTLNTASHALAQGKLVCAVPGNITSLASTGCNSLLRHGATLITSADDVVQELGLSDLSEEQTHLLFGENEGEEAVLALLRAGVRDGSELQTKSGLSVAEYSQAITMLEIKGVVRALGANQWSL